MATVASEGENILNEYKEILTTELNAAAGEWSGEFGMYKKMCYSLSDMAV